jgi:hypothetical protein
MTKQGRPTTTVQRVDVSASHYGPSAVLASPESDLFHAYRGSRRTIDSRPCECGGVVHANPAAPWRGVQAHNFSGRHKAWRAAREA